MASQKEDSHTRVDGKRSSLEIFLFTNGQQESPPRKYNIRVNDRWDTTLNLLARSQNGSKYSIDLYTTEGKKIERVLELTDGVAYVAVEPPQTFIPAGYGDYLAKASRSREKRQEKVQGSDLSLKAKDGSNSKIQEENKDTTNIKIIQDITIQSTSRTAVEEHEAVTNKFKSDIAKAVRPIKRLSLKPTQKRNNSLPQQNPQLVRRNTSNITAPIKRGSNLSKIDASKKKVEVSSTQNKGDPNAAHKAGSVITKTENNSKDNESGVSRVLSNPRNIETLETYKLLNVTDTASTPNGNTTSYKSTQNYIVDATAEESNILLPVSQENKPRESAYIIPVKIRSITNLFSNKKDSVSISKQEVKNVPDIFNSSPLSGTPQTEYPKGATRTESKTTFATIVASDPFQKNTLMYGNQTGDNSFSMFVKQGDIVHLKLNIEVKNVSNTTIEASRNHQVKSTATPVENTPLIKFKCDTPSNQSGTKTYRDVPTLTEPWLAGLRLPFDHQQQFTNDLKATPTTANCSFCSCPRNPESLAPVYVDNNNYFILLPPEDTNEHLVSCSCKLEINPQSKSEIPSIQVISRNGDNIVKLGEGINLPVHPCNITELNESCKNPEENKLLTQNAIIPEKDMAQCDCCVCLSQNPISVCECTQSLSSTSLSSSSTAAKQHASGNKSIVLKDACTQTDWSGVVLEARPLEDGCYAFHIPSIKLLKTTNSLYG